MSSYKFKNGDTVAEDITGLRGTIISRTDDIDEYRQYLVQPPLDAEGKFVEPRWISEGRLNAAV